MFVNRCSPPIRIIVNKPTTTLHTNMRTIFKGTNVLSYGYNVVNDEYCINTKTISFSLKLIDNFNGETELIVDSYIGRNSREINNVLKYII